MKPKNSYFLRFVWYFYPSMMYQKSEWFFFDEGSIDGKSEVNLEKTPPVEELKLKMKMLNMQKVTFSISTLPLGGTFKLLLHLFYLWAIALNRVRFFRFLICWVLTFTEILLHVYQVSLKTCTSNILSNLSYIKDVMNNHVLRYFCTPQVFVVAERIPYIEHGNCHFLLQHNNGRDDYLIGHGRPIYVWRIIYSDSPWGPKVPQSPK